MDADMLDEPDNAPLDLEMRDAGAQTPEDFEMDSRDDAEPMQQDTLILPVLEDVDFAVNATPSAPMSISQSFALPGPPFSSSPQLLPMTSIGERLGITTSPISVPSQDENRLKAISPPAHSNGLVSSAHSDLSGAIVLSEAQPEVLVVENVVAGTTIGKLVTASATDNSEGSNGAHDANEIEDEAEITAEDEEPGPKDSPSVPQSTEDRPSLQLHCLDNVQMPASLAPYLTSGDGDELTDSIRAPPIKLSYNNDSYWLFATHSEDQDDADEQPIASTSAVPMSSALSLLFGESRDQQLYYNTLDNLFERLHAVFPSFRESQMEIKLCVLGLSVEIPEDNSYARDVSLHDLDRIHIGCELQGRLHITLLEAPRFVYRFNALAQHVAKFADEPVDLQNNEDTEAADAVSHTEVDDADTLPDGVGDEVEPTLKDDKPADTHEGIEGKDELSGDEVNGHEEEEEDAYEDADADAQEEQDHAGKNGDAHDNDELQETEEPSATEPVVAKLPRSSSKRSHEEFTEVAEDVQEPVSETLPEGKRIRSA